MCVFSSLVCFVWGNLERIIISSMIYKRIDVTVEYIEICIIKKTEWTAQPCTRKKNECSLIKMCYEGEKKKKKKREEMRYDHLQ